MEQIIFDEFFKSFSKLNEEINAIKSPVCQAMAYFEGLRNILLPVWKNGYEKGLKEGLKQGEERVRIVKSN